MISIIYFFALLEVCTDIQLTHKCMTLFSGIPLTVHSARPSSRSSIRSTGSIGSYGNRRASAGGLGGGAAGGVAGGAGGGGASGSGGSKGILVSTSRTGAARSAAILLISCHIAAVSKQNSRASSRHTSGAGCSQHSRDDLDDGGGGGGTGSGSGCRSCESTLDEPPPAEATEPPAASAQLRAVAGEVEESG